MIKNKAIYAMLIGSCVLVNSMTGVYADTGASDTNIRTQIQVSQNDELRKKQQEIDKYVFEDHKQDFAKLDIIVTNTGVIGDYVEIGIMPFNERNANYLYEIFGKEMVKVVEGIQAVTLDLGNTAPDAAVQMIAPAVNDTLIQKQQEIDKYVFEDHQKTLEDKGITVTHTGLASEYVEVGVMPYNEENADYLYEIFGKDMVKVVEGVQIVLYADDSIAQSTMELSVTEEKEASPFAAFFIKIWEWIMGLFN